MFKGKLTDKGQNNPASWKTRMRCALSKSPEFTEVPERAQLDISEPYKVYRLVPISEQGEIHFCLVKMSGFLVRWTLTFQPWCLIGTHVVESHRTGVGVSVLQ